jgi:hypothetical protein
MGERLFLSRPADCRDRFILTGKFSPPRGVECIAKNQSPFIKVEHTPLPAELRVGIPRGRKPLLSRDIAVRAGFVSMRSAGKKTRDLAQSWAILPQLPTLSRDPHCIAWGRAYFPVIRPAGRLPIPRHPAARSKKA